MQEQVWLMKYFRCLKGSPLVYNHEGKWTIIKVKNCEILVISIINPSCQMKYRELHEYFVKKLLPAAINFELTPNNPDNRVAVKKKHSADGIPRF